eukprot:scaffold66645_cov60-Phaeocystis_antarctica.AAC.2
MAVRGIQSLAGAVMSRWGPRMCRRPSPKLSPRDRDPVRLGLGESVHKTSPAEREELFAAQPRAVFGPIPPPSAD